MKMQRTTKRPKTARQQLTIRIPAILILAVTIIVAIMCVSFYLLSQNVVSGLLEEEVNYIARQNASTAESYFESMDVYAESLSKEVLLYRTLDRADAEQTIVQALKDVVGSGRVFSAYFAFEPNAFFKNTPDGISYYAYQNGNDINVDILNDYATYKDGDYYAPIKNTGKPHITEPYQYQLTSGKTVWLVTLGMPIFDSEGNFLGVSNCDILSDSIGTLDYSTGGYTSSYSAIMTSQGTYVAHTADGALIGSAMESKDFSEIGEKVSAGDTVTKTIPNPYSDQKTALAIYQPITLAGTDLHWVSSFVVNQSEAFGTVSHITLILCAIGIAGILILGLLCFWIIRRSLAPVQPLMRLAEKMGRYDLSEDSENYTFPNNELGELADIFIRVSSDLKEVVSDEVYILNEMAGGNFTVRTRCEERYVGELRNILVPLRKIRLTLGSTLRKINIVSDRVAEDSQQISGQAQSLAQGATEQASSIEELSAMINSISGVIAVNAKSAVKAGEYSTQSNESVSLSNQYMAQLTEAMSRIAEASEKIQKVNKVISDIAFQTNILSLNAAVEAARAGSAGRGFAVVAEEVRSLAQKSAAAAKDTAELVETAVHAVGVGSNVASQTAQSLKEVAQKTLSTNELVLKISEELENQSTAVEQIRIGIDQISTVVQVNSATSEESAAASHELSVQAREVKSLVGAFRVPEEQN